MPRTNLVKPEGEKPPLCKCGCGKPASWKVRSGWSDWYERHHLRVQRCGPRPLCACGCAKPVNWIVTRTSWGTWRKGHHVRRHGDPKNFDPVEAKKNEHIFRKYGITRADYDAMAEAQNHKCAICATEEFRTGNARWAIDHCHSTGAIRGLLCSLCNTALGSFKDDPKNLIAAIAYLERHSL